MVLTLTLWQVQRFRSSSTLSLITHFQTKICVYSASQIPRPPNSAAPALVKEGDKLELSEEVHRFVPRLCHRPNKDGVMPSEAEFQQRANMSLNVKPKFCLLSEVADGRFCDVVVQVCRDPYDLGDKVTLYVSDYTENLAFFNCSLDGIRDILSRRGDPYGYTVASSGSVEENGKSSWVGPLGKRSIQVTAFEPHASFIREHVGAGMWMTLRNLQIKHGHDNQNLEGKLRGDQHFPNKLNVSLADTHTDSVDPRLKEAVRRCREYHREKEAQLKQLKAAETAGAKRKAAVSVEAPDESVSIDQSSGETKSKAQVKRARQRAKRKGEVLPEKQQPPNPQNNNKYNNHPNNNSRDLPPQTRHLEAQLNPNIAWAKNTSAPVTPIASILAPSHHLTTIDSSPTPLSLAFINAKYQTHVRVVDFFPPSLEDFSVGRQPSQYSDIVSSPSSSSSSSQTPTPTASTVWEWRFALQLEDAFSEPPSRVWVVVNNAEGQMLTGLDATDLRRDIETLSKLHNHMFVLWGNLGEIKAKAAKVAAAKRANVGQRPPDSEDEEEKVLVNRPFTCCIEQYGVPSQAGRVEEGDQSGQEWMRVFALFGTSIKHV